MRGYVGVTDPGWYAHLSRTAGPKDANFWRPSTRAFRLPTGTPFFFKLKAPHDAIAGFGYFASFTILPDWLAWETFGEANGVESLAALRARLVRIRTGARIDADGAGCIGCCLIAESHYFPREAWVRRPSDWSPRTQTGAGYDLTKGEGARIWAECRERVSGLGAYVATRESPSERYGKPVLHAPRLGQGIFRVQVLDAYRRACAVTTEHSLPVLEAAHIKPYSAGGEHSVPNGLLLRSDIHRLFDRGYVTFDEELRFVVSARLKKEFENGKAYYDLAGRRAAVPDDAALRPLVEALTWHRNVPFRG